MELFDARYNLAQLHNDTGNLDAARTELTAALDGAAGLIASSPRDADLRLKLARTHYLLGTLAEQQGNFPDEALHYGLNVSLLEQLVAEDPKNAEYKNRLAVAYLFVTIADLITGRPAEAAQARTKAEAMFGELLAVDGQNVDLREHTITARLLSANSSARMLDPASAIRSIEHMITELESIALTAPTDREAIRLLAMTWRVKGGIQLAKNIDHPTDSAAQAVVYAQKLQGSTASSSDVGEGANTRLFLGQVLARTGDQARAHMEWLQAKALLEPRVSGSRDWRILDPYARILDLLGQSDAAGAIIRQLRRQGYVPLQPWSESALAAADSMSVKPSQN